MSMINREHTTQRCPTCGDRRRKEISVRRTPNRIYLVAHCTGCDQPFEITQA